MEQLTSDLSGVAVHIDDILVSGEDAEDHQHNLRELLKRLDSNGIRCRYDKCAFAQPQVTYLGYTLSRDGLAKGPKVDAVMKMQSPNDVTTLRSFLGSIQFYGKFLPDLATVMEPLTRLTRKDTRWKWTAAEQDAFDKLKSMLNEGTVLAHFDPSCPIGISCDASEVEIGAVLFHRYSDGSERPIANASKTLSPAQKKYLQFKRRLYPLFLRFIIFTNSLRATLPTGDRP